ncbi:MAG: transporter substrate-binding domain-containing protein [Desulfobacteraceae bacterium]|nr:transporter substrate-binding domain-containing protein [Desulfobacteraceae bacterium]
MKKFIQSLCVAAMVLSAVSAFGQQADKIDVIHIATPEYKDQTNKDGTGLYFDIVRGVYEPEGIKMTFEIVPWKRAEKMLEDKQADAMVSAIRKKERLTPKYPMFMEYLAAFFKKETVGEWKGIQSLNNRTAIWMRGYDCHEDERLKGITFKKWDEIDDYETGLKLIEKGRHDFFIDALVDINGYLKTKKPDNDGLSGGNA